MAKTKTLPVGRSQRGFTLFELLVVLAILGLTLAFALPRLAAGSLAVETQTRETANDLRRRRGAAIATGRVLAYLPPPSPSADGIETILRGDTPVATKQILFFPDGSSSGGTLEIRREAEARAITIDSLTGRIAIARP